MQQIPKIIHLISATNIPPLKYAACINKMQQLHPRWQMRIWNDMSASAIVEKEFPDWRHKYDNYKIAIQRTDIFRIMTVYLYGGFYLDMDIFCLRELDDLCDQKLVLGVEKTLSPQECKRLRHHHPIRIANYMFGSTKGHRFWLDFLREASRKADSFIHNESDVLETTGPGLLTNVYHQNAASYDDITLLPNISRPCPIGCGPSSCHFGDYAIHLHFGSWRWQTQSHSPK